MNTLGLKYRLEKSLLGISGRTQPSTFLEGTLMTFSAAQSPFYEPEILPVSLAIIPFTQWP